MPFVSTGQVARYATIYGTLAVEGIIPILLVVPKTRIAGMFLAWGFHMILGINGFYAFSMLSIAFYSLFLFTDVDVRGEQLIRRLTAIPWLSKLARLARSLCRFPVLATIALAAASVSLWGIADRKHRDDACLLTFHVVWLLFVTALAFLLLIFVLQPGAVEHQRGIFRFKYRLPLLGTLLLALNGLCPYVGIKNESSFTMFSNLQTEGDQWNHLFLPRSMRIFPLLNDPVTIVDSSEPRLEQLAKDGTRIAYPHFLFLVSQSPNSSVTYEYRGDRSVVTRIADDPTLSRGANPVIGKLFWFREVPPPEKNTCRH